MSKQAPLPTITNVDYLVFDVSNLMYRNFYANKTYTDDIAVGLTFHSALVTFHKYYQHFNPKKVVMAFDGKSWRREWMCEDDRISKRPYKGNRRKNQTPQEARKYEVFVEHLNMFKDMIVEHTGVIALYDDTLEADDLISGFCQIHNNHTNVIVSADSDYIQFNKYPNTVVLSPITDSPHDISKYDNSVDLYMFTKIIRGDASDNIQSAYPQVRMNRIKQAFSDEYHRANLMLETWTDPITTKEIRVMDSFVENETLIDLTKQPTYIKHRILNSVLQSIQRSETQTFNYFKVLRFVGKHNLERIKHNIDQYAFMLK